MNIINNKISNEIYDSYTSSACQMKEHGFCYNPKECNCGCHA